MKKITLMFLIGVLILSVAGRVFAAQLFSTRAGYLLGVSEGNLIQAMAYAKANDQQNLQKMIEQGVVGISLPDIPVYVGDVQIFKGICQIQVQGRQPTLWMELAGIQPISY